MKKLAKKSSKKSKAWKALAYLLAIVCVLISAFLISSFNWAISNFAGISMPEIVFTLNMPLVGSNSDYLNSYLEYAKTGTMSLFKVVVVCWILRYFLELTWIKCRGASNKISKAIVLRIKYETRVFSIPLFGFIKRRDVFFRRAYYVGGPVVLALTLVGCFIAADKNFSLVSYIQAQLQSSTFIKEEYVDPNDVELTFPEEKQNLIWIYVESLETYLQDVENGGAYEVNYISQLTELAYNNISFSSTADTLVGADPTQAGWTTGGLVAQTSGVPLKVGTGGNSMDLFENFLPGVTTLGDILLENGYSNYFMAGSIFSYGGRSKYFTQHGDYEILDYYPAIAAGVIPSDYYVWWGLEDSVLFEWAKEKLLEIAETGEPFNFSILTVDSHFTEGYICSLCGDEYDEQYANVWSCTSKQVSSFVAWIQEQDFYENTTIIVTGDHCSMNADFYDVEGTTASRAVYNAYINVAIDVDESVTTNRQFATIDYFATALAALGVEIEGDRLGLSTNLFSGRETLVEEYGLEYVAEELGKKSNFYDNQLLYH